MTDGTASGDRADRRTNKRAIGSGLVVLRDGKVFPLINISVGGVCFQSIDLKIGQSFTIVIAKLTDKDHAVTAKITVCAVRESYVHAEFFPTMDVMGFVIRHIAECEGTTPTYFKK